GLALVHWERKRFRIAREFTIAGLRYAPVEVAGPLSRLRLPSEPKPYGSTVQLFNEVNGLLARYSADRERFVATHPLCLRFLLQRLHPNRTLFAALWVSSRGDC